MLPIWRDDSKSLASIKHVLDTLMASTNYLNLGQTSVIGFDQLLYAIAKKIQWHCAETYGKDRLVLMLGNLYIEMVILSCLGDLLGDSGWTTALSNAGVTPPGNDSLCTGHAIAKTKYVHQVTDNALYILMIDAFQKSSIDVSKQQTFDEWLKEVESRSPQFKFWSIALRMELDYLLFLRAVRKGDFLLYIASTEKLLPWIFALDHIHYSRWLTVHHYDMEMLSTTTPDVFNEFCNGNFTVKLTRNPFSAMGLNQHHEQLNKDVKGKLNIQCNNDRGFIAHYSVDINFVISIIYVIF